MWWRSVIFTGILFGAFFALIPNVLWVVCALAGRIAHVRVPYAPFGWFTLGLVLVLWGALLYGRYVGMWRSEVKEVEFVSSDVPEAFSGFRIVHISDLHVDTFDLDPSALERIVDKVNALDADVILFTGDMVTGHMDAVYRHVWALSRLSAREGVMSVLGNHDFFIYDPEYHSDEERSAAADSLAAFESEVLGWKVLRNSHVLLRRGEDAMAIAGVDNINGNQGFTTIQKGDLKAALSVVHQDGLHIGVTGETEETSVTGGAGELFLGDVSREHFTVLMSHDPSHWAAEVLPKSDVAITLSGHTHAAQVRLFGWALSGLMFREHDGRYDAEAAAGHGAAAKAATAAAGPDADMWAAAAGHDAADKAATDAAGLDAADKAKAAAGAEAGRSPRMLYVNAGIGCTAPFRIGCPSEITLITLKKQ